MLTVAPLVAFVTSQAALGRIPTIVATSIAQIVRLGSWSVQKGHEIAMVAPVSTRLACQEPLAHTIPALPTSYGLLG